MAGTDPFAMHNPVVLVLLLLVTVVAVPVLFGVGLVRLVRARRRGTSALPGLAVLAVMTTVTVYGRGLFGLVQDESSAVEACQRAVGPALASDLTGYDTSFLPLRFACRVDGRAVELFVPGWVNPTALALAATSAVLMVAARRAGRATTVRTTSASAR